MFFGIKPIAPIDTIQRIDPRRYPDAFGYDEAKIQAELNKAALVPYVPHQVVPVQAPKIAQAIQPIPVPPPRMNLGIQPIPVQAPVAIPRIETPVSSPIPAIPYIDTNATIPRIEEPEELKPIPDTPYPALLPPMNPDFSEEDKQHLIRMKNLGYKWETIAQLIHKDKKACLKAWWQIKRNL